MDDREIDGVLEARRDELEEEIRRLTDIPRDPTATVSFGKRIGDGTVEAVERITRTSAAKSLATKLRDVERALAKLADGTHGVCDGCSAPIPRERLEAMPWAVLCVPCAEARADR
ncbi:MAG: TraR/DksA family transcriptional regulator [Actinomycetota bacterium]